MTASRSPATRLHRTGAPWWLITAALGTLWCLLSFPFLTSAGVGTGEAYNYSLALADGVQQLRAGEAPVLVGQTEFAFNGRVHPLRNAPYLFYLAGLLDVLTWRHLSFWQLQNLSIALSLALAVLTTWFGLRWSGGCSRITAFGLTALFVFSPALLGAAYSLDLFMTVHAAPFVTLALASALRECRTRSPSNDLLLALALGAAWWAHPPTALWTTAIAAPVRVAAIPDARWLGSLLRFLAAGLSIAALIAYVFVSATEITPYQQLSDHRADFKARFVDVTLTSIDETFPGVVLPVSREAQSLTDVQYGYGLATVLTLSLMAAVARLRTRRALVGPAMMLGAALLLVLLALPVPVLTSWIWRTLPVGVHTLTGAWPSQRLFLVAAAATVVAAAALQP
ncbi:MAG TPA: hypothetical protein VHF69_12945, partial [Candidatus Synoicihabitans sp.]|nr:hypothetical protein [Candidatus Synoicihabitans sp.]